MVYISILTLNIWTDRSVLQYNVSKDIYTLWTRHSFFSWRSGERSFFLSKSALKDQFYKKNPVGV